MFDDGSSAHRLVGKFFTSSTPPSLAETEHSLRKQWLLSGDMTVQKLDDGDTFLFEFIQKNDKEKILERLSPYNVNGVTIVIKDLNSSDKIDFASDSFSVAVVGLPSYLCTNDYLPTLKYLVGESNSVLHNKFDGKLDNKTMIYFQVDIDLTKPLRPGFYIAQNRFVEFKYWNLGDFCYNCGMVGHVKECCLQVKFPKERHLTATLRTHVYGPWLRLPFQEASYDTVLIKSPNDVGECEKSLSDPQFFIEVDIMKLVECNTVTTTLPPPTTKSITRFRFPCSYLDTETESTGSVTASKAHEVIRREIYENMALNIPDFTASLVEQLKVMKKDKFCRDDKWLTLKLRIIKKYLLTHVDCETMHSFYREQLVERNISKLINKRVEKKENLLSLSSWEEQITQVISEMGFTHYLHNSYVSRRAKEAMTEAIQIEISSSRCTIPADRSTVCGLERFKVLGPDMDRLDPCVICAEEMFLAQEATILPCSHVFHSSCIEKWFRVGHKCPLCGFKLPSQK